MAVFTQSISPNAEGIRAAVALLKAGQCVAVPSETVYGLAANALDAVACRRIFEIKGRPLIDPLIVHCADLASALHYASFSPQAKALAAAFWPGPLTLVLPKTNLIPDLVTAGLPSVALRVPSRQVFRDLLSALPFPLAAPSANPFGYVSPTRAEHVLQTLSGRLPAVIDDGPCQHGVESTIVDLRVPSAPRLLRPGPISRQAIEAILKTKLPSALPPHLEQTAAQPAPGLLLTHYSPRTKLILHPEGMLKSAELAQTDKVARVYWRRPTEPIQDEATFWLSEDGNEASAAAKLFDLLQVLDRGQYTALHLETAPDSAGLSEAINDRLARAAAKR